LRIAEFGLAEFGKSTLPLLVAGVGAADDAHDVFTLDDLARFAHAFDGSADFHKSGFSGGAF
jgi:hypothetical protein